MSDDNEQGGRWAPYDSGAPSSDETPPIPVTGRPAGTVPGPIRLVGLIGVMALIGGALALGLFSGGSDRGPGVGSATIDDVPDVQPVDQQPTKPDILSAGGYADLVAAIRDTTGSSMAFDAALYPDYASVSVPEDATSRRERRLYWNGVLQDDDNVGTTAGGRVDLAAVDGATLVRLVRRASALVETPTSTYVIIRGAYTPAGASGNGEGEVLAYATNQYGETAYLAARLDGTVVRRYVSTDQG